MQAPPAYEGVLLYAILHRIEGDYDNARAWYKNVADSEVFTRVWDGEEAARKLVGKAETLVKKGGGVKQELEKESLREIKAVVDYCRVKFGEEEVRSATGAWVKLGEDHRKMGEEMVTGGKGYRQF